MCCCLTKGGIGLRDYRENEMSEVMVREGGDARGGPEEKKKKTFEKHLKKAFEKIGPRLVVHVSERSPAGVEDGGASDTHMRFSLFKE